MASEILTIDGEKHKITEKRHKWAKPNEIPSTIRNVIEITIDELVEEMPEVEQP